MSVTNATKVPRTPLDLMTFLALTQETKALEDGSRVTDFLIAGESMEEEADSNATPGRSTVADFQNPYTFMARVKNTGFCFFYNSEEKYLVLVFKGTQTLDDLSDDFRFALVPFNTSAPPAMGGQKKSLPPADAADRKKTPPPTSGSTAKVHRGFFAQYCDAKEMIYAEIRAVLQEQSGTLKHLFLCGHSLGGALATIAAADLTQEFATNGVDRSGAQAKKLVEDIEVLTLGSPRPGDAQFAALYDDLGLSAKTERVICERSTVGQLVLGATLVGGAIGAASGYEETTKEETEEANAGVAGAREEPAKEGVKEGSVEVKQRPDNSSTNTNTATRAATGAMVGAAAGVVVGSLMWLFGKNKTSDKVTNLPPVKFGYSHVNVEPRFVTNDKLVSIPGIFLYDLHLIEGYKKALENATDAE